MTMKLSAALPASDDCNGLSVIEPALAGDPGEFHVVIMVLDCKKIETDTDTGEITPTARIRRCEVVTRKDDKARLRALATRAFEKRTGKTVLPLDLEDELRDAFGGDQGGE